MSCHADGHTRSTPAAVTFGRSLEGHVPRQLCATRAAVPFGMVVGRAARPLRTCHELAVTAVAPLLVCCAAEVATLARKVRMWVDVHPAGTVAAPELALASGAQAEQAHWRARRRANSARAAGYYYYVVVKAGRGTTGRGGGKTGTTKRSRPLRRSVNLHHLRYDGEDPEKASGAAEIDAAPMCAAPAGAMRLPGTGPGRGGGPGRGPSELGMVAASTLGTLWW